MSAELHGILDRAVKKAARDYFDAIEMMCEQMLVQPGNRGVLVHDHIDGSWEVELSLDVPFGQIHHRRYW